MITSGMGGRGTKNYPVDKNKSRIKSLNKEKGEENNRNRNRMKTLFCFAFVTFFLQIQGVQT